MNNFENQLENDMTFSFELDQRFYKLKYPKLKHFQISVSIVDLFQPIEYNTNEDIRIQYYNTFPDCDSFILDLSMFEDKILNHDKIIRYLIYNDIQFKRDYFYENIYKVEKNGFEIRFGT